MTTHPKRYDNERLRRLAMARAAQLRREALDGLWDAVGRRLRRLLAGRAVRRGHMPRVEIG